MAISSLEQFRERLTDGDDWTRLEVINELKHESAEAISFIKSLLDDGTIHSTDERKAAVIALGEIVTREANAQPEAIQVLTQIIEEEEDEGVREHAILHLSILNHPDALQALRRFVRNPDTRETALANLMTTEDIKDTKAIEYAVEALSEVLSERDAFDVYWREQAVWKLSEIGSIDGVTPLVEALIDDPSEEVQVSAANALRAMQVDWQQKAESLLNSLDKGGKSRAEVDEVNVLRAIMPPEEERAKNEYLLTGYLISQALGKGPRMTDTLAGLITQSAGENPLVAGQRINAYQKENNIPETEFRNLRIAVGGETALDPIMRTLTDNLHEYFQVPIHQLNEHTREMWQKTMVFAQVGFITRIAMSIIVFLVGMALVSISTWQVLSGNLQLELEQLLGPGVSFVSGLGTMLLIVYTGPLSEIRRAVFDLGIGSAAFIAFVHRVLETSHTFSFKYLKQEISFEEMKKSSDLIESAMSGTISMLRPEDAESVKDIIKEAMAAVKPSTKAAVSGPPSDDMGSAANNEEASNTITTVGENSTSQPLSEPGEQQ